MQITQDPIERWDLIRDACSKLDRNFGDPRGIERLVGEMAARSVPGSCDVSRRRRRVQPAG